MLKKLYDKSQLAFALVWIGAYCVLFSVGDNLSAALGVEKSVTLLVGLVMTALLFGFLAKHGLLSAYGLCRAKATPKSVLYYIPLFLMLTVNLWHGVALNCRIPEAVLHILTMLCVGFLEEVIFRGLLFSAMRQSNLKAAVIVSSLTFGIGHIINLLNGSGADLVSNLLQVVYATAAGFMFVMLFCKTKSLLACIVTHGIFNALSVFAGKGAATPKAQILSALFLTLLTGAYALYLALSLRQTKTD